MWIGGTTPVFAHIVIIASSGADKGQIIEVFNITGGFQLLFLLFISLMTFFQIYFYLCMCLCLCECICLLCVCHKWMGVYRGWKRVSDGLEVE